MLVEHCDLPSTGLLMLFCCRSQAQDARIRRGTCGCCVRAGAFSSSRLRTPMPDSSADSVSPVGPAPTITTGQCSMSPPAAPPLDGPDSAALVAAAAHTN